MDVYGVSKNDEFVKEVLSSQQVRLIPNTVFLWANLERCFTLDISGLLVLASSENC
jgi:hypothetical protein